MVTRGKVLVKLSALGNKVVGELDYYVVAMTVKACGMRWLFQSALEE